MRILLGVPVHQDKDIFEQYLKSLDRLVVPEGYTLDRCFYLHDCRELWPMLKDTDMVLYNDKPAQRQETIAHIWDGYSLSEVARMKNEMLQIVRREKYDYYFLVDSDLILHPNTLQVLLSRDKDIISEIFWTEWIEGSGQVLPNCWDRDFADIEQVGRYRVPGVHETGGTGALILIKAKVLERVDYSPLKCVSFTAWEDRAFMIRAECAGYLAYIDTTLPARHLYRRSDYEKYMRKVAKNENKS